MVVDSPNQTDFNLSISFTTFYQASLNELLGENGAKVIYKLAGISSLESEPEFGGQPLSFDEFTGLQLALEQIYGEKGSLSIARRAGRMTLEKMVAKTDDIEGNNQTTFDSLNQFMDFLNENLGAVKVMVSTIEGELGVILDPCPECRNRVGEHPLCNSILGFLDAGLEQISASPYTSIVERGCRSTGHTHCEFLIT
jgi:predicted hydrocarbon binding protein